MSAFHQNIEALGTTIAEVSGAFAKLTLQHDTVNTKGYSPSELAAHDQLGRDISDIRTKAFDYLRLHLRAAVMTSKIEGGV